MLTDCIPTYVTHLINPRITQKHIQTITGTILGGSSIVKPSKGRNCYLSMRTKDGLWLDHKAEQLADLSSLEPITIEKTNRWHSLCYPVFNEFREKFYDEDGKRKLRLEHLDPMHDVALAVWFGDSGKIVKDQVILNTHIWKEDTEIIHEYLDGCRFDSEIFYERKNYRIRLTEESSKLFLKLVLPQLPSFFIQRFSIPSNIPNRDQ